MNFQNKNGLKGQHILAQGNALGKFGKSKTVRDGKMEKAKKIFRTELRLCSINNYRLFRPQKQLIVEKRHLADNVTYLQSTQGDALGFNNFPLSGERKIILH